MTKKRRLKKIALAHAILAAALFGIYIILSLTYSPEFFFSDIKSKFSALADDTLIVTAKVLAPPVKPEVSISGACDMGVFKISLSWPSDENSIDFDISRDGFPLATGLSSPQYIDSNTEADSTYTYTVTAHGPMGPGFADSDPVEITSPNICGSISVPPTIALIPTDPDVNDGYYLIIDTTRPRFTGTTNLPNAIINLEIHSDLLISGQTTANINGYWSWDPPLDIPNGPHTLYATAIDPLDPSQSAYGELNFIIDFKTKSSSDSGDSGSSGNSHKKGGHSKTTVSSLISPKEEFVEIPLEYTLNLQPDSVRQGKAIEPTILIKTVQPQYEGSKAELAYEVYDQENELIFSEKDPVVLSAGKNIGKNITLPSYIKDGQYMLKTRLSFDSFVIEHEHSFNITPNPFLNLGGNVSITYPAFLSAIGTMSMLSLLLLILWLFLFYREYWLYLHAAHHITEKTLEKLGLISIKKRKGVSK
jgi:hypothetical protein